MTLITTSLEVEYLHRGCHQGIQDASRRRLPGRAQNTEMHAFRAHTPQVWKPCPGPRMGWVISSCQKVRSPPPPITSAPSFPCDTTSVARLQFCLALLLCITHAHLFLYLSNIEYVLYVFTSDSFACNAPWVNGDIHTHVYFQTARQASRMTFLRDKELSARCPPFCGYSTEYWCLLVLNT